MTGEPLGENFERIPNKARGINSTAINLVNSYLAVARRCIKVLDWCHKKRRNLEVWFGNKNHVYILFHYAYFVLPFFFYLGRIAMLRSSFWTDKIFLIVLVTTFGPISSLYQTLPLLTTIGPNFLK